MVVVSWAQRFVSKVRSYQKVFKKDDPDVKAILCDLGRLAPIDPTSKLVEPYRDNEVFIMIGRRQVVSHILAKINMTEEELSNTIKQEQLKQQQNDYMKG